MVEKWPWQDEFREILSQTAMQLDRFFQAALICTFLMEFISHDGKET
jgi:hypothetical protein